MFVGVRIVLCLFNLNSTKSWDALVSRYERGMICCVAYSHLHTVIDLITWSMRFTDDMGS